MGHWPKQYQLFPTLIVGSSGNIMFGLVGKYIGNKETKGCHKRWLKLWLKDKGGEALSYEGFSDCVIVSVTELLVRLVKWSQASGKHFSKCEESLIPEAEDVFTTGVCGPRNHSRLAPAGHTELQHKCTLYFKSLLMRRGCKPPSQERQREQWCVLHTQLVCKWNLMMHQRSANVWPFHEMCFVKCTKKERKKFDWLIRKGARSEENQLLWQGGPIVIITLCCFEIWKLFLMPDW